MTTNYQSDLGTSQNDDSSSSGAKEQAKEAAGSAAEQTKHVAGVAQDEATRVASEASTQLRGLVQQATSQLEEQSSEQKTRLAETVRSFADDLESMQSGEQTSGLASQAVQQVTQQAKELASRLENREPRELLDDVRRFARRRPGTFLLGALAAGVITGRLTRAGKAAQDSSNSTGSVGTSRTVGTPPPASPSVTGASTKVAPIPPTDDVASPAYLSDETGTGDLNILGTPAADQAPGTTAGPGTGRS
jgi:hypothetical protein